MNFDCKKVVTSERGTYAVAFLGFLLFYCIYLSPELVKGKLLAAWRWAHFLLSRDREWSLWVDNVSVGLSGFRRSAIPSLVSAAMAGLELQLFSHQRLCFGELLYLRFRQAAHREQLGRHFCGHRIWHEWIHDRPYWTSDHHTCGSMAAAGYLGHRPFSNAREYRMVFNWFICRGMHVFGWVSRKFSYTGLLVATAFFLYFELLSNFKPHLIAQVPQG